MKSGLFPTGPDRMNSYLAGLKDPLQYSEHVRRSLEAFMRGGWVGVGIGKSQTKLNGLPFPHTDSVFAVVGEETGVLGAGLLVILFLVFYVAWLGDQPKSTGWIGDAVVRWVNFLAGTGSNDQYAGDGGFAAICR